MLTDVRAPKSDLHHSSLRVFSLCLIAIILSTADQSLFSYAIPGIQSEFDIDLTVIGYMLSASFFVASFAVVVIGVLADRLGRKKLLVVSLGLSALFVGCHSLVNSLVLLTVLRILGFALGAGLYLVASTMVIETASDKYRGLVAGILQIGYPLGFALSAAVITPFIDTYGWRSAFLPAFVVLLCSPLMYFLLPESARYENASRAINPKQDQDFFFTLKALMTDFRRPLILCFLGSFAVCLAIGGTSYFLPTYLVEEFGYSLSEAGKTVGRSYAIGAVGYLLASSVGQFVMTRRDTLIIWVLLGGACFSYTVWQAEPNATLLIGLGITIMFLYGSEAVRMPMIGELFPTRYRATATAVAGSLAVTIAWLIAPLVLPMGIDAYGWSFSLTVFGIMPLFLSAVIFLFVPNRPSSIAIE